MNVLWTPEEDAAIRYAWTLGNGAVDAMQRLPRRTKKAIAKRASILGVSASISTAWCLPRADLLNDLECRRLARWATFVQPSPRFGVAMIGGGYV